MEEDIDKIDIDIENNSFSDNVHKYTSITLHKKHGRV